MMNSHRMEKNSLQNLRSLISDSGQHVFIVDSETGTICASSKVALAACGSFNPEGERIEDVVHIDMNGSTPSLAFFNSQWFEPVQSNFYWKNKAYKKVILKHSSSIPDEKTLFTIRNMIAVLLHRLRSPMTGMQGYLEMIQGVNSEPDKRKLEKVGEGLDYLFEIMDELELLHHAEAFIDTEPTSTSADADSVIKEILFSYPAEVRDRIRYENSSNVEFLLSKSELGRILTLLIDNATEHPSGAGSQILIEVESNRKINITNGGSPIPDEIVANLYFPFVTTKANNLGIGLSLAQLMAGRRHATVFLAENSTDRGITFSLLCSPVA